MGIFFVGISSSEVIYDSSLEYATKLMKFVARIPAWGSPPDLVRFPLLVLIQAPPMALGPHQAPPLALVQALALALVVYGFIRL